MSPRYGTETNYKILREWLLKMKKQPAKRVAWLVRTCLKYRREAPDKLKEVFAFMVEFNANPRL
jgi:hypothetical protein